MRPIREACFYQFFVLPAGRFFIFTFPQGKVKMILNVAEGLPTRSVGFQILYKEETITLSVVEGLPFIRKVKMILSLLSNLL
jgi:hypothetical protein